ncbi:MAG: response regulator transcription factor [Sphingopyxis sp.]|uniref:response regulator transcription factor n=1 Tax=Sphingopyxis sp. TaxID=1908224 RepID=UPI002ABCA480|nr:response regulator transcription factor [Sphingopyxis sp.]MDZ3833324.1 response regulator transcription factor [Sphingopyxis sp.]
MAEISPRRPIRLLLVEDDFDVSAGLADYLVPHGVSVEFSYSVRSALALALEREFDVAVLDIELPDGDGRDLCRSLRSSGFNKPIIMLTARASLDDKLAGFDAGAVDYMVKPFAPAELKARIFALHRQVELRSSQASVEACGFSFSLQTGVLRHGPEQLVLAGAAFEILKILIARSPGIVRRSEIEELLWQGDAPASDPLRMHIYELRKLLTATFGQQPIVTVRGAGYRFGATDADL